MNISPDFISELRNNFDGDIRVDPVSRVLYSTDASIYQIEPLGVVIPRSQEDLIAAVNLAVKYKIPMLPRGSGSSLAGQAIGQALIIDCSRYLDKMPLGINIETGTAVVEPGVILARLNREAARYGLMFGPDPASAERATMGGVIGNNATGAHSILYGMTADHLESAEVILSDGSLATWGRVTEKPAKTGGKHSEIVNAAFDIREQYEQAIRDKWPKTWRNSAGYRLNYLIPWSASRPEQWAGVDYPPRKADGGFNLATMLAGSEGTLAVVRSATIKLVARPKYTALGVLSYTSIAEACDAVPGLLEKSPSAVELVPQMLIRLARSVPAYAGLLGFVEGDPAALLVVEFSGDNHDDLVCKVRELREDVLLAKTAEDQAKVWAVRKVGLGIFDSRHSAKRPVAFIEDCAIPAARLGEFVRQVESILEAYDTHAAFYAHASAGCLHIRPILDLKSIAGVQSLRGISQEVLRLTLSLGGSMSSEHGDGLVRAEWLKETYGDPIMEAMKKFKRAADPDGLFCPKKMSEAPAMDSNLRYGNDYQSSSWISKLDFGQSGGVAGAIEQCNGQGVCRKHDGVMCPSFQATREEIYSTRGRANVLRAMISIGKSNLTDEQVKQTMDLCLACKGCKAECPSSVDMAKLKYEFQAHYYETHTRPWRDYLFGYIGLFARVGQPFGGLINWVMQKGITRRLADRFLGISHKRVLPKFSNRHEVRKSSMVAASVLGGGIQKIKERCLFLRDTFTHFFEPEVEQAAFAVLAGCGINAEVLRVYGAGRTLLSKGFIKAAQQQAGQLLDEIRRVDPQGQMAVVGLEPSEIYMLRDDMFALLPERREEIESLAARAWLIDEFLIRPNAENTLRIAIMIGRKIPIEETRILLHAHCYQKAQPPHTDGYPIGVNASVDLLRKVGFEVDTIDSGCCGMAGAFGYESDHFDISMKVGELKLFPEVRKRSATGEALVAAVGTSCRSQIVDGTGVTARHSIMFVANKLHLSE